MKEIKIELDAIEELDTKRKQLEELVKQELSKLKQQKIVHTKKVFSQVIAKFEEFEKTKSLSLLDELIELYSKVYPISHYDDKEIMQAKQTLFKKLKSTLEIVFKSKDLKPEDMDKIEKLLMFKSKTYCDVFKDHLPKRLAEFKKRYDEKSIQQQDSHYILGGGEMYEDLMKFFELHGQLDHKFAPKDQAGIYHSPKFLEHAFKGAVGYYGKFIQYVYMDAEFSHEITDLKRFIDLHDQAYAEATTTVKTDDYATK